MEAFGGIAIVAIVVGIGWILIAWVSIPFILMGTNRRLDTLILTQQKVLLIISRQLDPAQDSTHREGGIASEILIRAKTDKPGNIIRSQMIEKFNISDQQYDEICRSLWQTKQIKSNVYDSLTKK